MKYLIKSLCLLSLFCLIACNNSDNECISKALYISNTNPDSSLIILNGLNKFNLSDKNYALYSLAYYKALDRKGMNVDNDSLLRFAYEWFKNKPNDSLYASCMYYMGKYYMLNDSSEQAISCLTKARETAHIKSNVEIESFSLEKLSKITRSINPQKALLYSRLCADLYEKAPNPSKTNKVYSILNVCECLMAADSISKAVSICQKLIPIAKGTSDKTLLSGVYQDLSNFYRYGGQKTKSLEYAKLATLYGDSTDITVRITLAAAYLEADSIKQAIELLTTTRTKNPSYKFTIYNYLGKACLKGGHINRVQVYTDSAYYYVEQMYGEAFNSKNKYYNVALKKEKENNALKIRNMKWTATFCISVMLFIFIIVLFAIHFRYIKKKNKEKRSFEEILNKEKLENKERQLTMMRNYIMRKVEIVKKIDFLKSNQFKSKYLLDEDWEELSAFLDNTENLFVTRLSKQFPNLTVKDIRLMMLLRLKMPQKTLAKFYGISEKAVKQKLYLYKSKVNIQTEKRSLRDFIEAF